MPKGASAIPKKSAHPSRRSKRLHKSAEGAPTLEPTGSQKKPCKHAEQSNNEVDQGSPSPEGVEADGEGSPPPQEPHQLAITRPSLKLIHLNLRSAWKINSNLGICFIFDAVSPARRFKRGMPYDDDADFLDYDDEESGNVTETDGDPPGFMPYNVEEYEYVLITHHQQQITNPLA